MMPHPFGAPPPEDGETSDAFIRVILILVVALAAAVLLRLAGA